MKIPEELHNSETGELLDECLVCHKNVVESSEPYFIEKVVRNVPKLALRDVLFEYAICIHCAEEMREKISEESMEKIQAFMEKQQHPGQRRDADQEADLEHCGISGKRLSDCGEFMYHAVCIADDIHPVFMPYAVSDDVLDEMGDQLSAATIDELDDFKGKHFTGPPEIAKLLSPRRLIGI